MNLSNKGFTLIEIMVAFLLVVVMMGLVAGGSFSNRRALDEVLNNIERASRFSTDESALRNVIVRTHFHLDKSPQSYAVEFGPDDNFVLSSSDLRTSQSGSERDQEQFDKKRKKFNKKFNRVSEFQESDREINDTVKIIGIGSNITRTLVIDGQTSTYNYPTGEKDNAIIILATDEEMASLSINPFTLDIERKYYSLPESSDGDDLEEIQIDKAQEIYKEWLK